MGQNAILNMFLFLKYLFGFFKSCKDLRTFLKFFSFSSKGPPFVFSVICLARFHKWQGVDLKIEISSFHQTFSFCEHTIA